MSDSRSGNGGLGVVSVLFLIFLTLKLTGHIAWSWWWVTSPLWTSAFFLVGFVSMLVLVKIRINRRQTQKNNEILQKLDESLQKHRLHVMREAERRAREREEQGR